MQVERELNQATTRSSGEREEAVQRKLDQAKKQIQEAKVESSYVLELNCERNEGTKFYLTKDDIDMTIDLYDFYGLDTCLRQTVKLQKQSKAYLPVFVFDYAGKKRVASPGIFTNKSEAEKLLPGGKIPPNEIRFKFVNGDSELIQYGPISSLLFHIPNPIEQFLYKTSVAVALTISPLVIFGLLAVTLGNPHFLLGSILPYMMVFAAMTIGFADKQARILPLDIETLYNHTDGEREFDVVECELETTPEYVRIHSPSHDATWTYEKNSMGEIPDEGKQVLRTVSIEGDECIACVSSTQLDQINSLESDCGTWRIEEV